MGLLDDAIREHLELKRSHGADPHEVARAEHEALEPVFADHPDADIAEGQPAPPAGIETEAEAGAEDAVAEPAIGDFSTVGQETAEIDMRAVLAEDGEPPADAEPENQPGQERLSFE